MIRAVAALLRGELRSALQITDDAARPIGRSGVCLAPGGALDGFYRLTPRSWLAELGL